MVTVKKIIIHLVDIFSLVQKTIDRFVEGGLDLWQVGLDLLQVGLDL